MRKLIANLGLTLFLAVGLVPVAVLSAGSNTAQLTDLTPIVPRFAELAELDASSDQPISALAVSPIDARTAATSILGEAASNGRVYSGLAAQYFGESPRDVLVVVVTGGTVPFGGPAGEGFTDGAARVTGVITDAETGEFLRGFMFS
jgi:hypothetical protein